jgi:predicted ATPase
MTSAEKLCPRQGYRFRSSCTSKNSKYANSDPRAQAKLGDLLIDIASAGGGKTLLVETHSEHVLSRIRRRVAEHAFRKEDVAIYYLSRHHRER